MMPMSDETRKRAEAIAEALNADPRITEAWTSFDEGLAPIVTVRFEGQPGDEFLCLKVQDENGPLVVA